MFRILQEALRNVEQHSGATSADVAWNSSPTHARLEVTDHGSGFDPDGAEQAGHYGLIGIRERANEIGARISLDTAPGRGTRVMVEWEGRT
jgi:signal transduction histidine kinase